VLSAAGGRFTDLDGRPLAYGGAELYNKRGILASNGLLHDEALRAAAAVAAQLG
jgi:3'(2'), 5'-bisphosphate nucleotidase